MLAAPAAANTRDVFHFADPFDGSGQCDGFELVWEGHDRGGLGCTPPGRVDREAAILGP